VEKLTNEYEVVPFEKVIEVLNVSSVKPLKESNVIHNQGNHISYFKNFFYL